jgi:hypothetical protein
MVQLLWKAVWWFLKKLNIDLPCEKKKKKRGGDVKVDGWRTAAGLVI